MTTSEDSIHFSPDSIAILDYIIDPEKSLFKDAFEKYYYACSEEDKADGRLKELEGMKKLYRELGCRKAVLQYIEERRTKLKQLTQSLLKPEQHQKKTTPRVHTTAHFTSVVWGCLYSRPQRLDAISNKIRMT